MMLLTLQHAVMFRMVITWGGWRRGFLLASWLTRFFQRSIPLKEAAILAATLLQLKDFFMQ